MNPEKKWRRIEPGLYELPAGADGKPRYAAEWLYQGRKIRRRFRTVTLARQALYAVRGQIVEGRYVDRKKEVKTTIEEASSRFIAWGEDNLAKATQGHDAFFVREWKASVHLRGRTLDQIGPAQVEAWKLEMKAAHGIRQADYGLARLRRLFSLCVAWELCERNPVSGGKVKFYNPKGRRDRYITPEEETAILNSAPLRLRPAIVFSLHTGLRQGELLALTWNDFAPKVGRFGSVKVQGDHAKDREDRHIPLTRTARQVLDSLPRPLKGDARVFAFLGSGRANLNKLWLATLRDSKLNDGAARPQRITWHTLRHTYASRLVMAGVDLATVQRLLGHSNITTTQRYAHLARPHIEEAVLALDQIGKESVNIAGNGGGEPAP
jgi:integrase